MFAQFLSPLMIMLNNFHLAWYLFKRSYHQSHQRLLRYVQAILLLFIMTLSQTSGSIQAFLADNLQGLLGADMVLSQSKPLTAEQSQYLTQQSNAFVTTKQLAVTLSFEQKWQPIKLKAVDENYPLQGRLVTSDLLYQAGEETQGAPKVGHIWLDERVFASLSLNIGDRLFIAERAFIASKVLIHEPDRLMEGHTVEMRAMVNTSDFEQLNVSKDLVKYRYLIGADKQQVEQLIDWQKQTLPAAEVFYKNGRHPLARFWQRTENFIGLASIVLFFMAAIAVNQLTRLHSQKDQHFSAVCLSVGASRWSGFAISFYKWLIGVVLLLPVVGGLSFVCHYLAIHWLGSTFSGLNWQWQLPETLASAGFVMVLFMVFHLPVWLKLSSVSVAGLLNETRQNGQRFLEKSASLIVLLIVVLAYSDNGLLTAMLVAAVASCVLVILVLNWVTLTLGEKLTQRVSGLIPFSLFMMKQRLTSKSTQVLGVGLCAFLLLFTLMLLRDLGTTMSNYQRTHDGNLLVSQATESQMLDVTDWANSQGVAVKSAKAYYRAKVVKVNGLSLNEFTDTPSGSMATLSSAIRLHFTDRIPANNRVVDGSWWANNTNDWQQISVEQEVMTDMGFAIGDKLGLSLGSDIIEFTIVASHVYQSGGGSITFWLQVPAKAADFINTTQYSMASLELGEQHWLQLSELWQKYPTLRMTSLKEMTDRFDSMLAMITKVISGFSFLISLLAAIVIFASVKAVEQKEKRKNSIIMSFGFNKDVCFKLNAIEWVTTASIAALGAISGTYIAGLLIYQSQFSLTYQPNFAVLLATLAVILAIVCSLGLYASKASLNSSIRQLLADN